MSITKGTLVNLNRVLRDYHRFNSRYHREILVRDSSAALETCVWIFTDGKYGNLVPNEEPPHLHLTLQDAQELYRGLGRFLEAQGAKPE